jgi:S1-C subfamily serine protease
VPPWVTETRPPRRRSLPAIVVALLLVAAGLAGLAIGHNVWHQSSTGATTGNGGFNNGNGFPFGGNGGNGSGNNGGGSRFGSGGTIPGSTGNGSTGGNGPSDASSIAAKIAPALVDIDTTLSYAGGEAAGTGIVLTADGIVLTNNHVISGSTRITATDVGNRHQYSATVVGYDRTHDIAVIKLKNASGLPTASIADSSAVRVGDQVVGVGNAGGLGGTPSNAGGTVTALDQAITATDESDNSSEQLTGLIQVDADIQPGDSGGALVNAKSQVIGIDTAASQGFSFQTTSGQGFAIPINQGREISDEIRAGQASELVHIGPTAFLGVLVDVSSSGSTPTGGVPGAVLKDVVPQAPAAEAGLTQGDVITALGGHAITSSSGLTAALVRYHPGDKVQLQWVDDAGQSHSTTIRLATGPAA